MLNKLIFKLGLLRGLESPNGVKKFINHLGTDVFYRENPLPGPDLPCGTAPEVFQAKHFCGVYTFS